MEIKPGNWRDDFWRAFWRRQTRHLPPSTQITITGSYINGRGEAPAIVINDPPERRR